MDVPTHEWVNNIIQKIDTHTNNLLIWAERKICFVLQTSVTDRLTLMYSAKLRWYGRFQMWLFFSLFCRCLCIYSTLTQQTVVSATNNLTFSRLFHSAYSYIHIYSSASATLRYVDYGSLPRLWLKSEFNVWDCSCVVMMNARTSERANERATKATNRMSDSHKSAQCSHIYSTCKQKYD